MAAAAARSHSGHEKAQLRESLAAATETASLSSSAERNYRQRGRPPLLFSSHETRVHSPQKQRTTRKEIQQMAFCAFCFLRFSPSPLLLEKRPHFQARRFAPSSSDSSHTAGFSRVTMNLKRLHLELLQRMNTNTNTNMRTNTNKNTLHQPIPFQCQNLRCGAAPMAMPVSRLSASLLSDGPVWFENGVLIKMCVRY